MSANDPNSDIALTVRGRGSPSSTLVEGIGVVGVITVRDHVESDQIDGPDD